MTRMERFKIASKASAKAHVNSDKCAPLPKMPVIVETMSGHFVAPPAK